MFHATSEILNDKVSCRNLQRATNVDIVILEAFAAYPPRFRRRHLNRPFVKASSSFHAIRRSIYQKSGVSICIKKLEGLAKRFELCYPPMKTPSLRELTSKDSPVSAEGQPVELITIPAESLPGSDAKSDTVVNACGGSPKQKHGPATGELTQNPLESAQADRPLQTISQTPHPLVSHSMTNRRLALNKPVLQRRLTLGTYRGSQSLASPISPATALLSPSCLLSPITPVDQVIHTPLQPPEIPRHLPRSRLPVTSSSARLSGFFGIPTPMAQPRQSTNRLGSPLSPLSDLTNSLSLSDSPSTSCAPICKRVSYFSPFAQARVTLRSPSTSCKPRNETVSLASPLNLPIPLHSPLLTPTPSCRQAGLTISPAYFNL